MKVTIFFTLLVVTAAVVSAWELKRYSSDDCSGSVKTTVKPNDCTAFLGNSTMKYGDVDGDCKEGEKAKYKYSVYPQANCAGTATGTASLQFPYDVGTCTKVAGGTGSAMLTCSAFSTAVVAPLAIMAAIVTSLL